MTPKLLLVAGIAVLTAGAGAVAYQQGVFDTQEDVFYQKCEEILKARLTSPSSYERLKEPFVFITEENVATAIMTYEASNALGVMIGGSSVCKLDLGDEDELPTGDYLFQDVRVDGTSAMGWDLEKANRILDSLK